MTNIYWPVYKNLEAEITRLTYAIHVDDSQLTVYSSLISDLILRASAEIESIAKELYKSNGGTKTKVKYDSDALEYLNSLWMLDQKVVLISSLTCFQTNRTLVPFRKNERSTFHGSQTFSWNNSYQNLKHDRANSLPFGSLKYLFDIVSALYLYYKDETFDLGQDSKATSFPINLGSDLFSIKLHKWFGYDGQHNYQKGKDFTECLYITKYNHESLEKVREATAKMHQKHAQAFIEHPKFRSFIETNPGDYKGANLMWDVLGKEDYIKVIQSGFAELASVYKAAQYEGVINKNQLL